MCWMKTFVPSQSLWLTQVLKCRVSFDPPDFDVRL
eukprot:UN2501